MSDEYTDETAAGQVTAAPGSPLASLRDRRSKARNDLFLDLPVPRYDPPIFVRFKPLEQTKIAAGQKEIDVRKKDRDVLLRVNAGFIATACLGVFEVVDGEKVSVDPDTRSTDPEDWPKFGPELAALLGEEDTDRAVEVVQALYLTDGDILATAAEIAAWSGYSGEQLDQDFEGN